MAAKDAPSIPLAGSVAAVALVFVVLFLLSVLTVVRVPMPNSTLRLCFGAIDYFSPPTTPRGFSVTWRPALPLLAPGWGTIRGGRFFIIPLWLPTVFVISLARLLLRRAYAVPPGHCKTCRYNLRGNTSGRCPECGTDTGPA